MTSTILGSIASLDAAAVGDMAAADGQIVVSLTEMGEAIQPDLVGFNWRDGGQIVTDLTPGHLRMWGVDFSRITPEPGVYDWSLPDQQVDAIRATGAVPMIVLVARPPWASAAGSAGYEAAVEAAVRRYGVERVPAGAPPAIFESSNEPEFYPTSHGQLPWELPLDAAAQARAIARVEAETGTTVTWGGPGALFADPPMLEAFAQAASVAGRPADYLSFHSYSNNPFLGPDGAEHTDPAALLAYQGLARRNPAATPAILGESVSVAEAVADRHRATSGDAPDVLVSEWNLSAGGLDLRNDTHEGAAHAVAGLVELHEHGADAAQFFAAADRHCPQPADAPDPFCGDWGTATADGVRKPVWHAFELWGRLAGPSVRTEVLPSPTLRDTWALATVEGNRVRIVVASFSASAPRAQRLQVVVPGLELGPMILRTIGPGSSSAPPSPAPHPSHQPVELPANSVVLIEASVRGRT